MAKLVLSLNGAVQGEYELNQERLTIGRKPDNDIQIDNLLWRMANCELSSGRARASKPILLIL